VHSTLPLYPRETALSFQLIGSLVGPTVGLDANMFGPTGIQTEATRLFNRKPAAIPTELPRLPLLWSVLPKFCSHPPSPSPSHTRINQLYRYNPLRYRSTCPDFCPLACCQKCESYYIQDYNFACGSMWVWNMVSDSNGRNINWGCLRTGRSGEYLGQRGMEWREGGESCITRSFIICTLRQV
jgi:hypothetical protein